MQELYGWLKEYSPRSDRLFGLVCDYLETGADWRRLCSRLLPLLAPADLLSFATGEVGPAGCSEHLMQQHSKGAACRGPSQA